MAQNRETRMAITIGQEIYFHGRVRNEAERKFIIYHTFINIYFLICATNTSIFVDIVCKQTNI